MPIRLLLCLVALAAPALAQSPVSIVPRPARMSPGTGSVRLCAATPIRAAAGAPADILAVAAEVGSVLADQTCDAPEGVRVVLRLVSDSGRPAEGYRLTSDSAGIAIEAPTAAGLFYGVQTLRQLLPLDGSGDVRHVTIEDAPRFAYRGMHLDVARHLFPVAFIKRYIDLLSRVKLNVFHWHLTDDQGWRIEIKTYPRLTEVGAWRRETIVDKQFDPYVGDGEPYGGYYTQDEVREVVAYAAARHVTVIPEIEMPGHALAALAAYPELACTRGPFEVGTRWGVYDDIFCPRERTFAFLEDVLAEVLDLFPSRYIHIGGDEAPKRRWKESPVAQEVIRREGLRDEGELQSWFVRRIETFLRAHGRRLIGWDEILEGGLAPDATVMSWRGTAGGIEAARQGHDVVMTPGSHLYFDHYQGPAESEPLAIGGYTPLWRVYEFEPIPDALDTAEARHVLGAQANLWTEYITTPAQVEYMALPRMLALAEVVWSPRAARDWDDFSAGLPDQLRRLDALGVRYRLPEPLGLDGDRLVLGDTALLTLRSPLPQADVLWSADDPDLGGARIAEGPIAIPLRQEGVQITARLRLPDQRLGPPVTAHFRRATLRPARPVAASDLEPGLRYAYYERTVRRAAALADWTPTAHDTVAGVVLRGTERAEQFGVRWTGFLRAPADAVYDFALLSDDGSLLRIAGTTVIDHDGPHSARTKTGAIALAAGLHPFEVDFFQGEGDRTIELRMRTGDGDWHPVPVGWFFRRK